MRNARTVGRLGSRIAVVATLAATLAGGLVAVATSASAEVTYYEMQARHSGLCGYVNGGGVTDEYQLVQGLCLPYPNHLFHLQPSDDGHYRIVVASTGRCLDVVGASLSDRARVKQHPCHGGFNQQWALYYTDSGYYQIVARHSQKCLDVEGDKVSGYARIWQYTCDVGDNQQFRFV